MNIQRARLDVERASQLPIQNMEGRRVRCYAALALCDIVAIGLSFISANLFYLSDGFAAHGTTMIGVLVPVHLWMAAVNGSYSAQVLREPRTGAAKAIRALAFAHRVDARRAAVTVVSDGRLKFRISSLRRPATSITSRISTIRPSRT